MVDNPFSVYILSDPRTKQVRYVGISCRVKQRYLAHLRPLENASKIAWVQELKSNQLQPVLSIIEADLTFDQAKERELAWIQHYLECGLSLVNISGVTSPWVGGVSLGKKKSSRPIRIIEKDFVTVKEVSTELGLSAYTVREMLRNDEMPGYRWGREWRIERAKYEAWKKLRQKPNRYPSQES